MAYVEGARGKESVVPWEWSDCVLKCVISNMSELPACAGDQENTGVKAAGFGVGYIGVGALHPHGKVVIHEQIENAIYAVGRNALPASLRHEVGNVIG